jgi:mannose/fructose-specific phosphotransferase system component IIA
MPVRGIIIAHSVLAHAFLATVEKIIGAQDNLIALSNENLSNEELDRHIRGYLEDGQPTIFLTDFNGGSAFTVVRLALKTCSRSLEGTCAAVTGINLPMLISFVTKRNSLPFTVLVDTLREDGHRGIQ